MFTRLLAAALTTAALVAIAPAAQADGSRWDSTPPRAEDRRACVSAAEFNGDGELLAHMRRDLLERYWDVEGQGVVVSSYDDLPYVPAVPVDVPGATIVQYPACGYSLAEAGVYVHYSPLRSRWFSMERWAPLQATLHGRPRLVSVQHL